MFVTPTLTNFNTYETITYKYCVSVHLLAASQSLPVIVVVVTVAVIATLAALVSLAMTVTVAVLTVTQFVDDGVKW